MKKSIWFAMLVFASTPARAENTVPATVGSDYDPLVIKVDGGPAVIDLKSYKLNAKAGVGTNPGLGTTYRLELEAGKKFVFGKDDMGAALRRGVGLYAGGRFKGDLLVQPGAGQKGFQNTEINGGGLTVQTFSMVDRDDEKEPSKARMTMSVDIGRLEYLYREQAQMGVRLHGMKGYVVSMAGHGAFKVGGLPVDICGQMGGGRIVGPTYVSNQELDETNFAEGQACVGVGLGRVGHLGYNYKVGVTQQNDKGYLLEQSHELALRKIGGTPLAVSGKVEQANSDVFSGVAGSERSYSAKMVTVGGEF